MRSNPSGPQAQSLGDEALRTLLYDPTFAALLGVAGPAAAPRTEPTWLDKVRVCENELRAALLATAEHFGMAPEVAALRSPDDVGVRRIAKVHIECTSIVLVAADQPDVAFRYHGTPPTAPPSLARVVEVFAAVGRLWAQVLPLTLIEGIDRVLSMGCDMFQLNLDSCALISLSVIERFVLLHHDCDFATDHRPYDASRHCHLEVQKFASDTVHRRVVVHQVRANPRYYLNRFVSEKRGGL